MSEPQCTKIEITVSTGGSVQIVKFKLRNDFGFGYTEQYTIPSDWTPERIAEWQEAKTAEVKAKVDTLAQDEQDTLLTNADWYDGP